MVTLSLLQGTLAESTKGGENLEPRAGCPFEPGMYFLGCLFMKRSTQAFVLESRPGAREVVAQ